MEIKTVHTLVNGDSRNLSLIPDKSVHLIITSPPYWQLKDYGDDRQIGFHDSYESYINNVSSMKFNLLKIIELPLRSRTGCPATSPRRGGEWGWCPLKSRERFMRMSGGHSKASRVATATGD